MLRFGDGDTFLVEMVFWFPASPSLYWRRRRRGPPRRETDFCPRVEGRTYLYLDKEVNFYLNICVQICHFEAEKSCLLVVVNMESEPVLWHHVLQGKPYARFFSTTSFGLPADLVYHALGSGDLQVHLVHGWITLESVCLHLFRKVRLTAVCILIFGLPTPAAIRAGCFG